MPIKNYSAGARKALAAMQKRYGAKKGKSIFYAKANERGSGKTIQQKANSIYAKGSTYSKAKPSVKRKRRKTKR